MKPVLIFLIGSAGSGKSTIGKKLASAHHFCYLDKDVLCNTFTGKLLEAKGYSPHARDGNVYYRDTVMPLEYETLLNVANDNLQLGRSVILDAPFVGYFSESDYIQHLIVKYQWVAVIPVVLQVNVREDVLRQRLQNRGLERDAWKLDHWEAFVQALEANVCMWENIEVISVDNSSDEFDLDRLTALLPMSTMPSSSPKETTGMGIE
ncbi:MULTISPECIES: AAA family ATPase [Paenibacillus]|uniref:Kinase n=1 Tax=Paenibacillus pabuli TaxID=1472 RepID=A0A855YA65_9BACL|nr:MULTISPECIES: ATP-binding protein [Paenibacillus]PWW38098.1 putative kinase [Paenibacillus pabuli]PXW08325.1 putative kinase [Paenibacillus taichungensis]RAI99285.1 putative kinase [Paenibacillus pabuli]